MDVFHFSVSRVVGSCRPYVTLGPLPPFIDVNGKLAAEIRQSAVFFLFME
jgi:hypothetical protein